MMRSTALQRASRAGNPGSTDCSGGGAAPEPTHFELRDAPPWSEEERLASEYAMLGFYVSGHPLEKYASRLQDLKAVPLGRNGRAAQRQRNCGCGAHCRDAADALEEGRALGDLHLQDMTGVQELLAFPGEFYAPGNDSETGKSVAA